MTERSPRCGALVWAISALLATQLVAIVPAAAEPGSSNSQSDLAGSLNGSLDGSFQGTSDGLIEEVTSSGSVTDSLGGAGLSTVGMLVSLVMIAATVGVIVFTVVIAVPKGALQKAELYLNAHRRSVLDGFALGGGSAVADFAGFFGIREDRKGRLGLAMRAAYPEVRALIGNSRHIDARTTLATLGALVMRMRVDPELREQVAHMIRIVPRVMPHAVSAPEAEARRDADTVDTIPVPPVTAFF